MRIRTVSSVPRRFLNTETAPSLYAARANVVGARVGYVSNPVYCSNADLTLYSHVDGENLKVDLTMAKALGGKGDVGKTNPEELFAAGYGTHSLSPPHPIATSRKPNNRQVHVSNPQ